MGLSVYWYKGMTPVFMGMDHLSRKDKANYLELHSDDLVLVDNIEEFQDRSKPYPRSSYRYTECGKVLSTHYSTYGMWREALAVVSGWPAFAGCNDKPHSESAFQADSGPFWELICFADNEGFIGSEAANRLWRDFVKYEDKFTAYVNGNSQIERLRKEHYLDYYVAFGDAFLRCASEGGVRFS